MALESSNYVPLLYHYHWQLVAVSESTLLTKMKVECHPLTGRVRGILAKSLLKGMNTTTQINRPPAVWLTTSEVCARLSISYDTWNKWRQRGVSPRVSRLPNGQLRTREDWLTDFMDSLEEAL